MIEKNAVAVLSQGIHRAHSAEWFNGDIHHRSKRLRATPSQLETVSSIESLLQVALPDKATFFAQWIAALADPSVCVVTLEDVKRLGAEDIASLPVPPLVKGVFREVLARESEKASEQHAVLDATSARARAYLEPLRDRNMQPMSAGSKYFQETKNYRLILTREEIEAGVRVVAHRLETWCKGERVVLVAILKGAFMFLADLCKNMSRPYSVYFVEASSYKDGRTQGSMTVSSDISSSKFVDSVTKKPHKIVLVDELLDNGKTMQDMKLHFLDKLKASHTENDVLTVCLFSKERARTYPEADITGIPDLPDLWLVGYGLDDRGTKRGWTELFATPKVKIVSSIEKDEVDRLIAILDEDAHLTTPHIFAGFELTYNHKQKYRVRGLDVTGQQARPQLPYISPRDAETRVKTKSDIIRALSDVQVVKGKYEREVQFAFTAENMALVPEDEIFYGNNQVYASMRCRLRKRIEMLARRCGVQGPGEICA